MNVPKVSVIIPTYNRAHYVKEALQSVLEQTYSNYEIIVVDDGSSDTTRDIVGCLQDDRITYIYQENRGVAAARNKGIAAARGEYVALLDSDDAWLPDFLSLMTAALDAAPGVAAVCSDCFICDGDLDKPLYLKWHGSDYDTIIAEEAERHPLRYLLKSGCFISPQATVLRSQVLKQTGVFDETLKTHEDLELFLRIVRDHQIKVLDIPLVKFRKHDSGLQSDYEQMYRDDITVMERALATGGLTRIERRLAIKRLSKAYFLWGWYAYYVRDPRLGWQRLSHAIKINPWTKDPYLFMLQYFPRLARYYGRRYVARIYRRVRPRQQRS